LPNIVNSVLGRAIFHAAFTAGIGAAYYLIGHADSFAVCSLTCDFATPLDRTIGFHPWWMPIYLSIWLLWWAPVFRLPGSEYRRFVAVAALCHLIAFTFFLVCTDERPQQSIEELSSLLQPLYLLTYAVDSNRNAFPSLHAVDSTLLIAMLWPRRHGRWLALWSALVLLASLLVKQHVVFDVVAGVLLALAVLKLSRAVDS
jgi:membrane-associated phospholipid phosphatase